LPYASKQSRSPSQATREDPYSSADVSPFTSLIRQVKGPINILVINNLKLIVAEGLKTYVDGDNDALTQMQPPPQPIQGDNKLWRWWW
jgi:hypothetical protein